VRIVDTVVSSRTVAPTPSAADLELTFYERFLLAKGLEPYPVQEQAIGPIIAGKSVMVTVPTGTGKTLMAKAALFAALQKGQKAVYTTPLRALTEEKFRELSADFGEDNVGFATGDYKVNREAPIQVEVAEILWNRIFGDRQVMPADVVVMDEGHYFNDPERGYVWEQSIIGLDPRAQLVILSATVGRPDKFVQWIEITRRVSMQLIESRDRKIPLVHEFREETLIDTVKQLAFDGDVPAIVFVFGRELCFEVARLLKSCRRFTSDDERAQVDALCDAALLPGGAAKELRPLLGHGIGVHHAGILPRYKQLVEELALARLIKFVVSTETIAAGINLPARTVVFPSLRKFIKKEPRLVTAAEYHQMSGRAGRPQFDDRGLAISLAPEDVVSEIKKETKAQGKRGGLSMAPDAEAKIRRTAYAQARAAAQKHGDLIWTPEQHAELVKGEPAELRSKTKITAEQVLAIGLPDLTTTKLPGADGYAPAVLDEVEASLPPSMRLDVVTVIDNLLLTDRERKELHKTLSWLVDNMKAIGVIDEHGAQISGQMIKELQGMDGLFIYYVLFNHQLEYEDLRALVELLVDHDAVQRILDRKLEDIRREWCRARLREKRMENGQVTWEDVEAEYEQEHPRVLTKVETIHQEFAAKVPHPELHGGKKAKQIWARIEDEKLGFVEFVEKEGLEHEEGSLFSYLVRVMNFSRKLADASQLSEFGDLADRVKAVIGSVDVRHAG
jgi:hypothetical protein